MSALVTTPWKTPYSSCNSPNVHGGIAQDGDHIPRVEEFGNGRSFPDQFANIGSFARQIDVQHVLGLDNAECGPGVFVENHEPGMIAAGHGRTYHFRSVRQVDRTHFVTRRHHGADGQIAETHHAGDHFLFAGIQHTGALGLDHQGPDLVFADFGFRFAALTEQPQQPFSRAIQHPHQSGREIRASNVM
jgi:hypothetical protein